MIGFHRLVRINIPQRKSSDFFRGYLLYSYNEIKRSCVNVYGAMSEKQMKCLKEYKVT